MPCETNEILIGRTDGKYTALNSNLTKYRLSPIAWPAPHKRPGSPELRACGEEWLGLVQGLMDEGKIRNHVFQVMEGGFEDVLRDIGGGEVLSSGFRQDSDQLCPKATRLVECGWRVVVRGYIPTYTT